jgi:hypothetical protein
MVYSGFATTRNRRIVDERPLWVLVINEGCQTSKILPALGLKAGRPRKLSGQDTWENASGSRRPSISLRTQTENSDQATGRTASARLRALDLAVGEHDAVCRPV